MRVSLGLVLISSALLIAAPVHAQPNKEKVPTNAKSRTILANLDTPVKAALFADPMKFSTFLEVVGNELERQDRAIIFGVDEESYREEHPDFNANDATIHLKNLPANTTLHHVLRQAIKSLPVKSAYVIRAGKVEILPAARTSKEYLLNQTFFADFSERRLDQALEDLSELTGVSIVLDARVKQKAQGTVSARFYDDVAVQDAVRILTEMAELKVVYLVTGLYVTTPEHAKVMQKELKDIYERSIPTGGVPMPGVGILPMQGMEPPPESPLTPPLPPTKRRLDAGAA